MNYNEKFEENMNKINKLVSHYNQDGGGKKNKKLMEEYLMEIAKTVSIIQYIPNVNIDFVYFNDLVKNGQVKRAIEEIKKINLILIQTYIYNNNNAEKKENAEEEPMNVDDIIKEINDELHQLFTKTFPDGNDTYDDFKKKCDDSKSQQQQTDEISDTEYNNLRDIYYDLLPFRPKEIYFLNINIINIDDLNEIKNHNPKLNKIYKERKKLKKKLKKNNISKEDIIKLKKQLEKNNIDIISDYNIQLISNMVNILQDNDSHSNQYGGANGTIRLHDQTNSLMRFKSQQQRFPARLPPLQQQQQQRFPTRLTPLTKQEILPLVPTLLEPTLLEPTLLRTDSNSLKQEILPPFSKSTLQYIKSLPQLTQQQSQPQSQPQEILSTPKSKKTKKPKIRILDSDSELEQAIKQSLEEYDTLLSYKKIPTNPVVEIFDCGIDSKTDLGFIRLYNHGNTCFFNTGIKLLYSMPIIRIILKELTTEKINSLQFWFQNPTTRNDISEENGIQDIDEENININRTVLSQLKEIFEVFDKYIEDFEKNKNKCVRIPKEYFEKLIQQLNKNYDAIHQQDLGEFLNPLLSLFNSIDDDEIKDSLNSMTIEEKNIHFCQDKELSSVGTKKLFVQIPYDSNSEDKHNITGLIKNYSGEETDNETIFNNIRYALKSVKQKKLPTNLCYKDDNGEKIVPDIIFDYDLLDKYDDLLKEYNKILFDTSLTPSEKNDKKEKKNVEIKSIEDVIKNTDQYKKLEKNVLLYKRKIDLNTATHIILSVGRFKNDNGTLEKISDSVEFLEDIKIHDSCFEFIGCCMHFGSTISSGHYKYLEKKQRAADKTVYYLVHNDSWCQEATDNELKIDFPKNCYVLYYKKKDTITKHEGGYKDFTHLYEKYKYKYNLLKQKLRK